MKKLLILVVSLLIVACATQQNAVRQVHTENYVEKTDACKPLVDWCMKQAKEEAEYIKSQKKDVLIAKATYVSHMCEKDKEGKAFANVSLTIEFVIEGSVDGQQKCMHAKFLTEIEVKSETQTKPLGMEEVFQNEVDCAKWKK